MIVASDGFHFVMYLFVIEYYAFIAFMSDVLFYNLSLYSFCCSVTFVFVFYVRVHFLS